MHDNSIKRSAKALKIRLEPIIKEGADTDTRRRLALDGLRNFIDDAKTAERERDRVAAERDRFEHLAEMLEALAKRERRELDRTAAALEHFDGLACYTVEDLARLAELKRLAQYPAEELRKIKRQ